MKTTATFLIRALLALGLGVSLARAADEAVASPAKRAEVIAQAKALLAAKEKMPEVKDPFHSAAYNETMAANSGRTVANPGQPDAPTPRPTSGPRTDRDILQTIAANLKPSGFFVLGGEPTLVFGQKRVKAGGTISIRFEDTDYTLEVASIDRPNFTLRLNREEFTRPIK
jgi:hypothetical protein